MPRRLNFMRSMHQQRVALSEHCLPAYRQHFLGVLWPTACNQLRVPQGEPRASRGTESDGDSVDSQSTREAQRQCSGAIGAPSAHSTRVQLVVYATAAMSATTAPAVMSRPATRASDESCSSDLPYFARLIWSRPCCFHCVLCSRCGEPCLHIICKRPCYWARGGIRFASWPVHARPGRVCRQRRQQACGGDRPHAGRAGADGP